MLSPLILLLLISKYLPNLYIFTHKKSILFTIGAAKPKFNNRMQQFRLDNQRTILTYSFKRLSPLTIDFKSTKYTLGWAINSVEECYLHTVEVTGSNPVSPTI